MSEIADRLKKVYAVKGADDCVDAYRDWADDYDSDLMSDEYGYVAPRETVNIFMRFFDKDAGAVLDAGCGTGLAGQELQRHGVAPVDGLDISPEMLAKAEAKGCYRQVVAADLTKPLALPEAGYGGIVSVGTFTHGHVGPEGLDHLLAVLRPGGVVTFSINEGVYKEYDFEAKFAAVENDGVAEQVDLRQADYLVNQGIGSWVCTFRKFA
ncbi:class I SAM-dependent DNA methyltransferase [Roseospirillum parvum]|uniref:Methyltransferase domain-containing protein n=1 Tax=Roseospirillum parvum TaxID=83401 RepID=A0A1G8FII9_9PROT|nr:class I SAM-dependent methyltransferase [Roseospirillum parvum]SDH81829.1 Methyltransferase domain-containing protein [Roseospirillum parvum]